MIDHIDDFPDVGMTEFTPRIPVPVQKTEIYQELDEEVFSVFDWANRLACRSKTWIKCEGSLGRDCALHKSGILRVLIPGRGRQSTVFGFPALLNIAEGEEVF